MTDSVDISEPASKPGDTNPAHAPVASIDSDPPPRGRFFALRYAISLLLATCLFSAAYLYHANSLNHNGRWMSGKMGLARSAMGAVAYYVTHTALFQNRLNLGVWHGYQEILYRQPLDLADVSFDFKLSADSYLVFEHHHDANGLSGLRVSNDRRFVPALLTAAADGAFTRHDAVTMPAPGDDWNRMRVVFADHRVTYFLNGTSVVSEPIADTAPRLQVFGFRGSLNPVFIDNVEIHQNGSSAVIREGFANYRDAWLVAAVMLSIVLLCNLFMTRRKKRIHVVRGNYWLCAAAIVFLILDFLFLSRLHPRVILDYGGFRSDIELTPAVSERLQRTWAHRPVQGHRILFIGASQTWGAGVSHLEDTFAARVEASLNRDAPAGERFESINAGCPGAWAPALAELYRRDWLAYRPEVLVVNLASNDQVEGQLGEAVENMARLSEQNGVRTIFVLEANSTEQDTASLLRKHAVIRRVAERHHMPLIDMHHELEALRDTGFVWWDFVHMTSYGHRLAADRLLTAIRAVRAAPAPALAPGR